MCLLSLPFPTFMVIHMLWDDTMSKIFDACASRASSSTSEPPSPQPAITTTTQEIDSLADLVRQKVAAREASQVLSVTGNVAASKPAPKKAKWSAYKGGLWGVGTKKAASVHAISVKKPTADLDGKKPVSPNSAVSPVSPVSPVQMIGV